MAFHLLVLKQAAFECDELGALLQDRSGPVVVFQESRTDQSGLTVVELLLIKFWSFFSWKCHKYRRPSGDVKNNFTLGGEQDGWS